MTKQEARKAHERPWWQECKPYVFRTIVFIHIPKTGGLWVRKMANEKGMIVRNGFSHILPRMVTDDLKTSHTLCTLVRHPDTWLQSWWGYHQFKRIGSQVPRDRVTMKRRQIEAGWTPEECQRATWYDVDLMGLHENSWEEFLRTVLKWWPRVWSALLDDYLEGYIEGALNVRKYEDGVKSAFKYWFEMFGEGEDSLRKLESWKGRFNARPGQVPPLPDWFKEPWRQANADWMERFGYE